MNYISLKQASQISGYHPDYLGQLIRRGKLKQAKKIGRDWFIAEQSIKDYFNAKNFFSFKNLLNPKMIFTFILPIGLLGIISFFIFEPVAQYQVLAGDFDQKIMASKEMKNIKVTVYSIDEGEEIEMSIQDRN